MEGRSNPWRQLRARPDLTLRWKVLPDGMGAMWRGVEIWIDPRLDRVARRCALMHELIHDERRIGWPFATAATMETEERIVREETARRLVPDVELAELVRARHPVGLTALEVAQEFDVTEAVAARAMRQLERRLDGAGRI